MRGNALLILHEYHEKTGTVRDHLRAISDCEDLKVMKVDYTAAEYVDLAHFNVILLHYSIIIASPHYVSMRLRDKIAAFRGLKILFIQDEYRWIDSTAEAIRDLGVHVVFSLCNPQIARKVYHHPWCQNIRFEPTLTGFVSEDLCRLPTPDYELRPIDVAYRARKLTSWMGSHTIQKWRIADRFLEDARKYGLAVDISTREEDRLYGEAWIDLMKNAKAVLGTESGASVCDFTGRIQQESEAYLERYPKTSFEELKRRFFPDADGKIVMNVISPRCFEAAALRTLMVMYEGEYAGILEAGRHYIELQRDHSNIDEVVNAIRSPDIAKRFIRSAYDEIAMSGRWTRRALTNHLSRVLTEEIGRHRVRGGSAAKAAATIAAARAAGRRSPRAQLASLGSAGVNLIDNWLPAPIRRGVRPFARACFRALKYLIARGRQTLAGAPAPK